MVQIPSVPVGNKVNFKEASCSNSIVGYWKAPDFDSRQKGFCYVQVIDIPTPRWATYDAKFFGVELPHDVPASIQDRAYTSPDSSLCLYSFCTPLLSDPR